MFRPGDKVIVRNLMGSVITYQDRDTLCIQTDEGVTYASETDVTHYIPLISHKKEGVLLREVDHYISDFLKWFIEEIEWEVGDHFPVQRELTSTIGRVLFGHSQEKKLEEILEMEKVAAYYSKGDFSEPLQFNIRTTCEKCCQKPNGIFDGKKVTLDISCQEHMNPVEVLLDVPSGKMVFNDHSWSIFPYFHKEGKTTLINDFWDISNEEFLRIYEEVGVFYLPARDFNTEIARTEDGTYHLAHWPEDWPTRSDYSTIFPKGYEVVGKSPGEWAFCIVDLDHLARICELRGYPLKSVYQPDNSTVLDVEPGRYCIKYYSNIRCHSEKGVLKPCIEITRVGDTQGFEDLYTNLQDTSVHASQLALARVRANPHCDPEEVSASVMKCVNHSSLPLGWPDYIRAPSVTSYMRSLPKIPVDKSTYYFSVTSSWNLDDLEYYETGDFAPGGDYSFVECTLSVLSTAISCGVRDISDSFEVSVELTNKIRAIYDILSRRYPEATHRLQDFNLWLEDTERVDKYIRNLKEPATRYHGGDVLKEYEERANLLNEYFPALSSWKESTSPRPTIVMDVDQNIDALATLRALFNGLD